MPPPPDVSWGQFVQHVSIPRFTCILCEKNVFPIGPAVWHFPGFWIVDPLNPPQKCCRAVSWGNVFFSLCSFPDESTHVYRICCESVHPFGSFRRLKFVFSICPFPDESADVYQIRCQSVQPFDSFPTLWNLWHPPPPKCPLGYWGATWI